MEIKITTKQVLKVLYVLSWIVFIVVCIEAGGIIFNMFYTLVLNPVGAGYFWNRIDLSGVHKYDKGHFFAVTMFMGIVSVMRAWIFYLVIKILYDKKLNLSLPFNKEVGKFIVRLSWLSFLIGLFSWRGAEYVQWLVTKGIQMPPIESLRLGGADVWLFMGAVLFVIAQIFKRGIEIQSENELTV
jgi:hypothetical protein